jgi:hypothetical protein
MPGLGSLRATGCKSAAVDRPIARLQFRRLSGFGSRVLAAGVGVLVLAGCGSGGTGKTVSDVASCLRGAGYGVTVVPTSQIARDGPENRGPGQTGELLVGRQSAKPSIGADDADAVVAFWKSAGLAKASPNAKVHGLGMHADAIGSITVQPTVHLVQYAIRATETASGRKAALQAQINKIESCVG